MLVELIRYTRLIVDLGAVVLFVYVLCQSYTVSVKLFWEDQASRWILVARMGFRVGLLLLALKDAATVYLLFLPSDQLLSITLVALVTPAVLIALAVIMLYAARKNPLGLGGL